MRLRDYQQEAVDTIDALPDGARTVCCLATGLGKTVVGASLDFHGGRVLWLSHRDELVHQPQWCFLERGMSVGFDQGSEHAGDARVVSASIQTISRGSRLEEYAPADFDTVIVDEAQHAAAPTYRKVLGYFTPRKLVGLTATPRRGDKVRLTDVFDDICVVRDLKWGIQHGWLVPVRGIRVTASFDMAAARFEQGDYTANSLGGLMGGTDDAVVVAKAYLDWCLPEGRQTLVYCPTVRVCEDVANAMRAALPRRLRDTVAVLHGGMATDERRDVIERYRQGDLACIVNCMILTEGTDLPATSAIIVNRPSANLSLYTQIVGRGTRLADGKRDCLVIDVCGRGSGRRSVCTVPTLFGIDPEALPKSMRDRIQGADMCQAAEDLFGMSLHAARDLRLRAELYDMLSGDIEAIVDDNIDHGLPAVASAWRRHDEVVAEPGDPLARIVLHRGPTAERARGARVSYARDEGVFLSEPDALGRVTVTAQLPGRPVAKSAPMEAEDAATLARAILDYLSPMETTWLWSAEGRREREGRSVSKRQRSFVRKLYSEQMEGDPRLPGQVDGLTLSDAGLLIDLRLRQQDAQAHADEARRLAEQREGGLGAPAPAAAEDDETSRREAMREMVAEIEGLMAAKTSEPGHQFVVSVELTSKYFAEGRPVSAKQLELVEKAGEWLTDHDVRLDQDPMAALVGMDSWHAGLLLSALWTLQKAQPRYPKGIAIRAGMAHFLVETAAWAEAFEGTRKVGVVCTTLGPAVTREAQTR